MPRIPKSRKKKMRQILASIIGALVVGYFLYHTIEGDRGWFAMLRTKQELRAAKTTLEDLRKEREELEHRTSLLKNDSLDPDLLEEKSRELLNYSKPNEIVILTPDKKKEPEQR